jgi:transposase
MLIIGCDYHPGFQQIAYVNTDTGELSEARLGHKGQAEQFYHEFSKRGATVRVGMEASGHARWFERLLTELQFELWIGDAAAVRTKRVRKQKTDRQDAQLLLQLLLEDRFPKIWVPDAENRDLRQLLWHRHRLVQMRTRVMNQLHVVALNEGLRRKKALWRPAGRAELAGLSLGPWASRRRKDLLPTRPAHAENPGTDRKAGTDRGATARDATTEHASRTGPADRTGIRVRDGVLRQL